MALFSERLGLVSVPEITIRDQAPDALCCFLLKLSRSFGLKDDLFYKWLNPYPAPPHEYEVDFDVDESPYPDDLYTKICSIEWYRVYDLIEQVYLELKIDQQSEFTKKLNECFYTTGIGFELKNGKIEPRGNNPYLAEIDNQARQAIQEAGFTSAADHLKEAFQDLGRRPVADLKGCISHATSSLESVAREVTTDPKATLGKIIKKGNLRLPKPLDSALAQLWGYASNEARHGSEEANPSFEEAELVFSLCTTMTTYILKKHQQTQPPVAEAIP